MKDDDMFCLIGQVEFKLKKIYAANLRKLLAMTLDKENIELVIQWGLLAVDKEKGQISSDMLKYWKIKEVGQ